MITSRSVSQRTRAVAVVLGLVGLAAPATDAGTALRWKFQPGEVLKYESNQTTVTKVKDPTGQEVNQTLTLVMDLSWRVREVDPQGVATLSQSIDRIRTTGTSPYGKFSFDSRDVGDGKGPAGPLFQMLVGDEFTFRLDPQGEFSDLKLADRILAALRDKDQPAGAQGQFSEAGLKNSLVQMGLSLPSDPVDPGRAWTRKLAIPAGPDGQTRSIEQTYTDRGPEADRADLEGIDMTTRFDPAAADPKITVRVQEATGHFAFNTATGRIASSRVVEKVDLGAQIEGKEVSQAIETVTLLTLRP